MAQNNCLPTQQEGIILQNRMILPTEIETPNKTMLLVSSIDEAPHQPTSTVELRAPVSNKTMLLAPPADKAPNQPTLITQLGAPAPDKPIL